MALASMPRRWPARVRRCAWSLAGLTGVGALIVLSDPDLARSVVRLLTTRNELSTTLRLDQAPQLLRGFRRAVFAGSGLGATLPSGFVRDPSTPWTFELTYLQLLFEVGVIGLAVVLAPAIACIWRAARSLRGCVLRDRPLGFATLGGLAGFLLAAAGNPYLLTSVGMFTLAVFVAMAEREMAGQRGTLRARRRSGQTPNARAAAFAVVVVATVARTVKLDVPASARPLLRQPLASEPARQRLWSFAVRGARVVATPLSVLAGRIVLGSPRDVGAAPAGASYQVGDWNGHAAAFELVAGRSSLAVRVISLGGHPRLLRQASGGVPALTRGWHRDLAVTTASTGAVVAVAVDRSAATNELRLSSFAVAPRDQPRTLEETAGLGPFTPARWVLRVGSVSSSGPDIALVGAPPGAPLQIHVLTASSGYAAFGEQRVIALRGGARRPLVFLIGHRAGSPVLYAVDPSRGTVEVVWL
jgi:hypothetical protein